MTYEYYQVPGTNIVLHTDPELERTRLALFKPLMQKHGHVFKHQPYTGQYKVMNPLGRCFDQAVRFARKMGMIYVEGFMVFQSQGVMLPIGHAWCIGKDGYVVDPTSWKHTGSRLLTFVGVPIRLDYAEKWKEKTGYYGCIDGYFDGETVHTNVGIYADPPEEWLQKL